MSFENIKQLTNFEDFFWNLKKNGDFPSFVLLVACMLWSSSLKLNWKF